MLKQSKFTEAAGWIGVVCILTAYALITAKVVDASDWSFHVLNGVGAAGVVLDAVAQKNWQPAVLNVIWLVIALVGIVSGM